MKNNTNHSKDCLIRALNNLPQDFALQETRIYINKAIQAIQKVEEKRNKHNEATKSTPLQNWNNMLKTSLYNVQTPITSKRTLDIINQMLEEEKNTLKQLDDQTDQTLLD